MKKISLVFLLTALLVLQACAPATPTPPITLVDEIDLTIVNELFVAMEGNDDNDCRSEISAYATIWGAIQKTTSPSIINIGEGTFYTTNVAFQPAHDTTFRGAGADATILMSDRTTTIIRVASPVDVVIKSLSLLIATRFRELPTRFRYRLERQRKTQEFSAIVEETAHWITFSFSIFNISPVAIPFSLKASTVK